MIPRRFFYSFLSACLLITTAQAQLYTEILWQNSLGSYQEDYLQDLTPAGDGRILVSGTSNSSFGYDKSEAAVVYGFDDYWIVMLDSSGTKLWDAVYGGNDDDKLSAAVPTADGGFLLAGLSRSGAGTDRTEPNLGTGDDYWVIRIDSLGNTVWDEAYGGSEWDQLYHAIQTDDGGFLLIGWSRSYAGFDKSEDPIGGIWDRDYWIVKIDSMGTVEWENTIGGNNIDEATGGVQTADGGYLIVGRSSSGAGVDKSDPHHGLPGIPTDDYWLVKLNAAGGVIWDKTIGGTDNDIPNGMMDCGDDTYLLYGYSYSSPGYEKSESHRGYGDYWIVKVDDDGNVLWDKTIGSSQSDRATCAIKLNDDYFVFGGTSWSPVNFDKSEANHGEADYWIVGTDGTGQVQWDDVIGCDEEDELSDMHLLPTGDILLAGFSDSDTCQDKNEMNIGAGTNESDYYVLNMRAYEFISKVETIYACFDSTYMLPWGLVVDSPGVYADTIAGGFLDTLYQVTLIQTTINDTLYFNDYYLEALEPDADMFTWIDCNTGDTIESGGGPWFSAYYDGEFAVIIEKDGCVDTSDCYFLFAIDVPQPTVPDIRIYPNPGRGSIQIEGVPIGAFLEIRDLYGQIIYTTSAEESELLIDISENRSGMYHIRLTYEGKQADVRYIKVQ